MSSYESSSTTRTGRQTVPQLLALIIGLLFTVIGVTGFFMTGFDEWTEFEPGQALLGFGINPLHNVVHLGLGVLGLVLARREGSARLYGWVLAIGYGATLVYGLVVAGQQDGNLLNINPADNVLHALSVIGGLATALWPRRRDRAQTGR